MAAYDALLGGSRVDRAVARLHAILPLSAMLETSGEDGRALHRRLLQRWLKQGAPLARKAMEESEPTAAARALLEKSGLVLFDKKTGEVSSAYPLTTETRAHRVVAGKRQLRALCAIDALAIGPMLGDEPVTVHSRCAVTGDEVKVDVVGPALQGESARSKAQVGVGWNAAKDGMSCASSLCKQIVFLRDAEIAQQWQNDPAGSLPSPTGPTAVTDPPLPTREYFSLEDALKLAAQFFRPLGAREQPADGAAPMEPAAKPQESLVISDPTKAEETEFLLLKGRPAQEYFGKLDVVIHGTDLLVSEDEYVDEELLLDGTWGSFEGVPNPEYLKLKKKVDAEKVKKEEDGQAAASAAAGDTVGADDKTATAAAADASAASRDKSDDEGSEEKQVARLHFFRSKVHTKDVNRLVVASFVSSLRAPRKKAKTSKQAETIARGGNVFDTLLVKQKQRAMASAAFGQSLKAAATAAAARRVGSGGKRGKDLEAWLVDAPNTMRHWSDQSLRKRKADPESAASNDHSAIAAPMDWVDDLTLLKDSPRGLATTTTTESGTAAASGETAASVAAGTSTERETESQGVQLPGGLGLSLKQVSHTAKPSPRTAAADALLTSPREVPSSPLVLPSPATMAPLQAAKCSMSDGAEAGLVGIDLTEVDTSLNWPQPPSPDGDGDALHSAVVEMPSEPHAIMGWLEALPSHLTAGGA